MKTRILLVCKISVMKNSDVIRYGFSDECLKAYGSDRLFNMLAKTFEFLPIAAIVDKEVAPFILLLLKPKIDLLRSRRALTRFENCRPNFKVEKGTNAT